MNNDFGKTVLPPKHFLIQFNRLTSYFGDIF